MTEPTSQLAALIAARSTSPPSADIRILAETAVSQHPGSVSAVLFYGSCLRSGRADEGIADLYLLVDDYRSALASRTQAALNRLLPPNVFYLEVPLQGRTLRAKYALLSLAQFRRGTNRWFHSYLWGRFAQPVSLAWYRDEATAGQIRAGLAAAGRTFLRRTLPQMEGPFTARELWARGLALSYRCELRSENAEQAVRLFDADPEYYEALTAALLAGPDSPAPLLEPGPPARYAAPHSPAERRCNSAGWRIRTIQGKLLSVLRLLKASLTFSGGIDYLLWKIERHSGVRVEVSPRLRRFPPLAICSTFWKLYRRKGFR